MHYSFHIYTSEVTTSGFRDAETNHNVYHVTVLFMQRALRGPPVSQLVSLLS